MQQNPNRAARTLTHGEAYARHQEYRARFDRICAETQPVHDEVSRLAEAGLTREQAWALVLERTRP